MGDYFSNEIVQPCGQGYETEVTVMGYNHPLFLTVIYVQISIYWAAQFHAFLVPNLRSTIVQACLANGEAWLLVARAHAPCSVPQLGYTTDTEPSEKTPDPFPAHDTEINLCWGWLRDHQPRYKGNVHPTKESAS